MQDGDAVVLFNFRADRMVEISKAFEYEEFTAFDRKRFPKVGHGTADVFVKSASSGSEFRNISKGWLSAFSTSQERPLIGLSTA